MAVFNSWVARCVGSAIAASIVAVSGGPAYTQAFDLEPDALSSVRSAAIAIDVLKSDVSITESRESDLDRRVAALEEASRLLNKIADDIERRDPEGEARKSFGDVVRLLTGEYREMIADGRVYEGAQIDQIYDALRSVEEYFVQKDDRS